MEKERVHFIDALRGYAILMMLQGHTVGVVLANEFRSQDYPVYSIWNYMRGITAPAFLFASGLILSYLLFSRSDWPLGERILKMAKRGVWLMVLGSVSLVYPQTVVNVVSGNWANVEFYKVTSVLHLIGLALVLTAGLLFLSRKIAYVYVAVSGLLALFLFLGAPWLRDLRTGIGLIDFFNQQRAGSIFILSPWLGHYFVGCLFGFWASRVAWYSSVRTLLVLIPVGLFVSREAFWYLEKLLVFVGLIEFENDVFRQGFDQIYRLGEVIILTAIIGLISHWGYAPKWLRITGRETLSIYMIHSAVVYSAFFGIGYSTLLRRELGGWETAGLALITILLFVALSFALPKCRKRFSWLNWIR